jgi:transcriptional regulator of acetoin/glycerol metabolism
VLPHRAGGGVIALAAALRSNGRTRTDALARADRALDEGADLVLAADARGEDVNLAEAARLLGVTRATLYARIAKRRALAPVVGSDAPAPAPADTDAAA